MKIVNNLGIILLMCCAFLISHTAEAQLSNCSNWNKVRTTCIGACGNGVINYPVLCGSAEVKDAVRFCVRNETSSLCPNTGAIAEIYVNGNLVASGDVTAVGSSVTFFAKCGQSIKVVTRTYPLTDKIQCIWLGELTLGLRRFN